MTTHPARAASVPTPWSSPRTLDPRPFLVSGPVIDARHRRVRRLAGNLRAGNDDEQFAGAAYAWVRDEIAHSADAGRTRTTLTASEVLQHGTGLCYAKAHLLTALLRAGGVPTGLCYQLLADERGGFVLHGLIAVHLRGTWHRQDPRGNRLGVHAEFSVGTERLAYTLDHAAGEIDHPGIHADPVPAVVTVLSTAANVLTAHLPDSLEGPKP